MPKKFVIITVGQFFSQFGDNLFTIAIAWYLAELTGNPLFIGIAMAVFNVIPLCNTFTGAFADRHRKLPIMLAVTIAQIALLACGAAFIGFFSLPLVAVLVVIQFACRIAGCFFDPAFTVLIPQLVDEESLQQANGIIQGVMLLGQIIGAAVGGILVAAVSPVAFLGINVLAYTVTFACLLAVSLKHKEYIGHEEDEGHWYGGLTFIAKHRVLVHIIGIAVVVNFSLGPIMSMVALWVSDYLRLSSAMYGAVETAFLVGAIAGSVLTGNIRVSFKAKMLGALFVMGASVGAMAVFPYFAVTLVANGLVGFAGGIVNVALYTIIQTYVPNEVLGRVSGTLLALTTVSQPLGMVAGGAVANVVGLPVMFFAGATLTVAVALCSLPAHWDFAELKRD